MATLVPSQAVSATTRRSSSGGGSVTPDASASLSTPTSASASASASQASSNRVSNKNVHSSQPGDKSGNSKKDSNANTNGNGSKTTSTNKQRRQRERQRRRKQKNKSKIKSEGEDGNKGHSSKPDEAAATDSATRQQGGTNASTPEAGSSEGADLKSSSNNNNKNTQGQEKGKQKKKKSRQRQRKNKKYPWRKLIPPGTVDPITLDELAALNYPPFALNAAEPYLPVPVWPPLTEENKQDNNNSVEQLQAQVQERERRLLQEQWGSAATTAVADASGTKGGDDLKKEAQDDDNHKPSANTNKQQETRHVNLFDGRALAYYMVSQLQFIDPLTRRDLHRDELCHLDRYLVRHGFTDLNVLEAYDTKGVSLSTAGAASTTAAGRTQILQQEARVLLNALFGGRGTGAAVSAPARPPPPAAVNPLMQQYSNYQAANNHRQQHQQHQATPHFNDNQGRDTAAAFGVFGDESTGMMVIDDDANPSLRGANTDNIHNATLWSGGRITGPQANASKLQANNFPALSATVALPPHQSQLTSAAPAFVPGYVASGGHESLTTQVQPTPPAQKKKAPPPPPPARSLKLIAGAVKKTTPEETQRQFLAREEARRKAMLSNLTFGSVNPTTTSLTSEGVIPAVAMATDGQLERNRALADALGIQALGHSTTAPSHHPGGWARPTNTNNNNTSLTTVTNYPDALILRAREYMGSLLKLEKKWKAFLEDDKAASLPLNKMERPMRAFVHEYSDFWKLHTESFDPEPRRYINCVKLLDTSAPYPLLSDAARHWKGPTTTGIITSTSALQQQTAGQDTWGQELRGSSPVPTSSSMPSNNNSRAAALAFSSFEQQQRPKLQLQERTLPLELPPFVPPPEANTAELEQQQEEQIRRMRQRAQEQKKKEQERKQRKQRMLEAAFASDSEEESLREMGQDDNDSDWEQGEALYVSDEE